MAVTKSQGAGISVHNYVGMAWMVMNNKLNHNPAIQQLLAVSFSIQLDIMSRDISKGDGRRGVNQQEAKTLSRTPNKKQ